MTENPNPTRRWPEMPYKGFSYYGPNDVPLFAGREQQVRDFARIVGNQGTRFVLLQGATGCGKSSFLRAGLIPYLQGRFRGFEFRRDMESADNKALFIRSTDAPLQKLAEEVFVLAREGYVFISPLGEERVDLTGATLGATTADDFVRLVIGDPSRLVGALQTIAAALPVTLVLVIDQGEEVLSLSSGHEADQARAKYFAFLRLFGASEFPLKLIVALRSDWFGEFVDEVQGSALEPVSITYYRLKSLGPDDLVRAIKRPTESHPVYDYPPPDYGFTFEEGLPELIVEDLKGKAEAGGLVGGELPVLQVVCESLYKRTRDREKPWVITLDDYVSLGDMETQLNDYVDAVLVGFCDSVGIAQENSAREILHWKDALTELAVVQANNAVTTDLKTVDDLLKAAGPSVHSFAKLLDYLADDEQGVLRRERIRRIGDKSATLCYSLRHDAIGLVLIRWRAARRASHGVEQGVLRMVNVMQWLGVGMGAALTVGAVAMILTDPQDWLTPAFILAGGVFYIFLGLQQRRTIRRNVHEFIQFDFQLLSLKNPAFGRLFGMREISADTLASLTQNPVFRLYWHTTPSVERRLMDFVQRQRVEAHKRSTLPVRRPNVLGGVTSRTAPLARGDTPPK